MKTHNDFLVEYSINGITISDYIAYCINNGQISLIGGDENCNKETPIKADDFIKLTKDMNLDNLMTDCELNSCLFNPIKLG